MQNGSSVAICARCIHVFACLAPMRMLSRCLSTKFLHRRSVGSLLSVRHRLLGCLPRNSVLVSLSLSLSLSLLSLSHKSWESSIELMEKQQKRVFFVVANDTAAHSFRKEKPGPFKGRGKQKNIFAHFSFPKKSFFFSLKRKPRDKFL